jgi:hypothetical protein
MLDRRAALLALPVLFLACNARIAEPTPAADSSHEGTASPPSTLPGDPSYPDIPDGGPACTYRTIEGTATVLSLESSVNNDTLGACYKENTKITFSFAADEPSQLGDAGAEVAVLNNYYDGIPTSCLAPAKISVGSTFRVTRREEITGTCSPLIYEIPAESTARICACTVCDGSSNAKCF